MTESAVEAPATETGLVAYTLFRNREDNVPNQQRQTWPGLVKAHLLEHAERENKDGPLFSPTLYREGATRGVEGVELVTALLLDFDDGTEFRECEKGWDAYEYAVHSTYSHTDADPHWRAVFPLDTPVPAADWKRVWQNLTFALGNGRADPQCKDASRIYWLPTCKLDAPRFAHRHPGNWIDPNGFPDVEPPPKTERLNGKASSPFPGRQDGAGAEPGELVQRAVGQAQVGSRNENGFWLACQLRDNGVSETEAIPYLLAYALGVPDADTYTRGEALHSLKMAFTHPAREPWTVSQSFEPESEEQRTEQRQAEKTLRMSRARELCQGIALRIKENATATLTPEIRTALSLIRDHDPVTWLQVKLDLQKAKVPLGLLDQALPKVSLHETDRKAFAEGALNAGLEPRLAGDMLTGCPSPKMIVPEGYTLTANLTNRISVDDDGRPSVSSVAFAPILIAGILRDTSTLNESLLLTWQDPGRPWSSRIVDRAVAFTGRELQKLAGMFPVADDNVKEIVRYLRRAHAANSQQIPQAAVTAHMGWQGKNPKTAAFMVGRKLTLPDGTQEEGEALDVNHPENWSDQRICFHGSDPGEEQVVDAFHAQGDFETWLEAVKVLEHYPKALALFYASFCSPLLEVFNIPNFVVDLSNRTASGKTIALRVAGSVWGDPDESHPGSVIGNWNATRVFTERTAQLLSGMPMIMDDTANKRNFKIIAEHIYSIVAGRGRGRGSLTGVANTATWRLVLLSTGEAPATSYTQDGGTRTRVLTICGPPFGDESHRELVNKLNAAVKRHFGHAGPLFVQWLLRNKHTWPEWQTRYEALVEQYASSPPSAEAGRLAQYAALITVVAEMVHRALGLPWKFTDPIKGLWEDLAHEAAEASGDVRALELVRDWASSREKTFKGRFEIRKVGMDADEVVPLVISGRWDPGDDWAYLGIKRPILTDILRGDDHNVEGILRSWKDRDWLDIDVDPKTKKKTGYLKRVRIGNESPDHLVVILRKAFEFLDKSS